MLAIYKPSASAYDYEVNIDAHCNGYRIMKPSVLTLVPCIVNLANAIQCYCCCCVFAALRKKQNKKKTKKDPAISAEGGPTIIPLLL